MAKDPPWDELVAWAETDLRRQVECRLAVASPVRPSSIIESTLLWAVTHRDRLHLGIGHATSLLAGVARFIQCEKFRYVSRKRRKPSSGLVLHLRDLDQLMSSDSATDPAIREAVAKLPLETQQLIRALYWELCTCSEYARRTGQSEKGIERAHRRALERLARAFGPAAAETSGE